MFNTEQEAATKWCPMVRYDVGSGSSYNRDGLNEITDAPCIGSDCMMWRWDAAQVNRWNTEYASNRDALVEADAGDKPAACEGWDFVAADDSDDGAYWVEPEASHQARRRGYCGLAGRPEVKP